MEWEKEAGYLAGLSKSSPYRVPDEYFGDLQSRIQQSIFLDSLDLKEQPGFKVPTGYFEMLDTEIEAKISVETIRGLTNGDGFRVPASYFDKLHENIVGKTSSAIVPTPRVRKLWHVGVMKYVSAACLFLIAASALYVNQQQNLQEVRNTELAQETMLYDIDESVIIEHLEESTNASYSNTASANEMENYILDNFSSSDLSNNL